MAQTAAPQQAPEAPEPIEDLEFATTADEHFRAGYQCMYISTSEEARVETELTKVAKNLKMGVITWDSFEGFSLDALKGDAKLRNPVHALEKLADPAAFQGNHLFVFRDLDDYFVDTNVRRRIKSLVESNRLVNKHHKRPLIVVSPKLSIHEKLRSCVSVLDFNLPGEQKLGRVVEFVRQSIESKDPTKAQCDDELRDSIVRSLMGLTSNESENCLSRCLVRHSGFKPDMLSTIKDEKAEIVKKSETLEYIREDTIASRDEIGGFENYLAWLDMRIPAYSRRARDLRIRAPKGVVLMGLPGSGKSMVGYATCSVLGLPGYRLDVGSVFGSLVGESEQRMRDAIKQIEAQQGCVLLVDEADKAFGNAHDSSGDSGVTKRVFGTFLSWLQDNKTNTFVIMTLNRTKGLPPEFLRAGRFDELFFTDLPHDGERRQILDIHFRKRLTDEATGNLLGTEALGFSDSDWKEILSKTNGFVGSELEKVVDDSRFMALARRDTNIPTFEEVIEACGSQVPLSVRDADGVNLIREYCKDKGTPVSRPATQGRGGRRSRAVDLN